MNRTMLLSLVLLAYGFCHGSSYAQKSKDSFGNVTQADLEMKVCPIDSSAPAFVVYDKGETSFVPGDGNFDVVYKRTTRIKILKKAGIRYSEMTIPLFISTSRGTTRRDEIRELNAVAYNLVNGKITKTKLDSKTIFEQKASDYLIFKKFAFPDVHEGSVLELRYEVHSPFKFKLKDWVFQRHIPVVYSECILKYTPYYLYTYLLKNAVKFDEYQEYQVEGLDQEFYGTTYKEGACRFVMKNVPAFTETEFTSSDAEYMVSLHFQLNKVTNTRGVSEDQFTTWDDLAKDLTADDSFGDFITSVQNGSKQILDDLKISGLSAAERFNAIVSWVKKNFSWDGQQRIYSNIKAKELLKRKSGSSAEINLFLCGMLKAAGLDAYPVLISTRGNARVIKDYPFLDFFNYVMVYAMAGDTWTLTDGTEPLCENNLFPEKCINGKGLCIKGDKSSWVEITPKGFSSVEDRVRFRFNPSMDSLGTRVTVIAKGYSALALRNNFGDDPGKAIKYFSETGIDEGDSVNIRNGGVDSVMKPYSISIKGKIPVETTDQLFAVDPFCNLAIKKNPFNKESRKYPVDMIYPENKTFIMELVIPEGYRARKLPESFSREDNLMKFTYTAQQAESKIMVHAVYSVKKSIYAPEEYSRLQQFFADIVKKMNGKIYIEKI